MMYMLMHYRFICASPDMELVNDCIEMTHDERFKNIF